MHEELRFGETTLNIGRPVHATSDHAARVRVLRYIREVKRVLRNSVASSPQDSIMSPLIVLCCIALAAAKPSGFHTVSYAAPAAVVAGPVSVSSQYHSQDALGQYSYGYSAGTSAKAETKTFDGVTRGGYSYLDSHGVVQSANYVADDVHGFQVAATNLPKHVSADVHDTPEVAAAKAAHAVAFNQAAYAAAAAPDVSESVVVSAPAVSTYVAPAVSTYVAPAVSTVVASAPAVSVVNEVPSKAFSYSTVAASPVVSHVVHDTVVPAVSSVVPAVSSVVSSVPVVASPAVTSYAVHDAVVPSKAFSYSTVSASPSVHVAAAPAAVSYSVASENVPVVSYSNVEHHVPVVSHHVPVSAVSYSVPSAVGVVSGATSHQYHAQDELGQYAYGYSGGPSAKVEAKTLDGITRGGYSYVDGNGLVQSASYVADDAYGFRVAATNIPVGPDAPVVHNVAVAPVAVAQHVVGDTPEVVAAKAAHFAAHAAVKARDYYDY